MDSIEYLEPDNINGLNLYCYCGCNPVMRVVPNGNDWWHWLLGAVAVVAVCALAVVVTVCTYGTGTLAFAVALGALKGAAIGFGIGAAAGVTIGATAGAIYSMATGNDFWTSVGQGALWGLGIGAFAGAIIGAIVGGIAGGISYNPSTLQLASNTANKAVPGKNFNINKHLSDAGGRYAKFNSNSTDDIVRMVRKGLKSKNVLFGPNIQKGKIVENSFKAIVNFNKAIGTKGQTAVKVIIDYGGKIWTMYPF